MRTCQNICAYPKHLLPIKIYAHMLKYLRISKNICSHLKYLRRSKISAPHLKYLRLIIYDSNKAAVEISAPDENYCSYKKSRRPSYAPIRKLGAQTLRLLSIWAQQNLQLLTSSG